LSAALGWFLSVNLGAWVGVLAGAAVLTGFLWYAHSGQYLVEPERPIFPLRRDERGRRVRDRAVVASVAIAGIAFLVLWILARILSIRDQITSLALVIGVVAYFAVSHWLFVHE
jgi:hypothetical protein